MIDNDVDINNGHANDDNGLVTSLSRMSTMVNNEKDDNVNNGQECQECQQ